MNRAGRSFSIVRNLDWLALVIFAAAAACWWATWYVTR